MSMSHESAIAHGGGLPPSVYVCESVAQALLETAARPAASALVFVRRDGSRRMCSYAELTAAASRILGGLRARGLKRGDRVIFQIADAESLLPAFWACILGGVVPVMEAPVSSGSIIASARFRDSWCALDKPFVLTAGDVDELLAGAPDAAWDYGTNGELAMLLLTSGSTGQPKLVRLTHTNVASGIAALSVVMNYRPEDVSLNWLPLYHVGALMRSIRETYVGCTQVQVQTSLISEDPLAWLDLVHEYQVTLTWAPDTALASLVTRGREASARRRWNLRSLRSLSSSGEPVIPRTARALEAMLRPHGLRPEAMHTAWGLTEACSATFSATYFQALNGGWAEVGPPTPMLSIRITRDDGSLANGNEIGEVEITGPQVSGGYEGIAAGDAFTADGWFRTGDLGLLRDGVLTITGRSKDIVKIGGVAYSNREIESVVETIVHAEPVAVASTLVKEDDAESLAIFVETPLPNTDTVHAVRASLMSDCGFAPRFVILLPPGELPRSASGKLNRAALRAAFAEGKFDQWRRWPYDLHGPRESRSDHDDAERTLAERIASSIGLAIGVEMGVHDDLFVSGVNSLRVVEAAARFADALPGTRCEIADLFHAPTPMALARRLIGRKTTAAPAHGAAHRLAARQSRAERAARRQA